MENVAIVIFLHKYRKMTIIYRLLTIAQFGKTYYLCTTKIEKKNVENKWARVNRVYPPRR